MWPSRLTLTSHLSTVRRNHRGLPAQRGWANFNVSMQQKKWRRGATVREGTGKMLVWFFFLLISLSIFQNLCLFLSFPGGRLKQNYIFFLPSCLLRSGGRGRREEPKKLLKFEDMSRGCSKRTLGSQSGVLDSVDQSEFSHAALAPAVRCTGGEFNLCISRCPIPSHGRAETNGCGTAPCIRWQLCFFQIALPPFASN